MRDDFDKRNEKKKACSAVLFITFTVIENYIYASLAYINVLYIIFIYK